MKKFATSSKRFGAKTSSKLSNDACSICDKKRKHVTQIYIADAAGMATHVTSMCKLHGGNNKKELIVSGR